MTYATEIKKVEMMPFAELFEITSGTRVFRYTSWEKDFTYGGNVYRAAVIKRSIPSEDESFKPSRMDLTMPVVSPVNEYIANTPLEPVRVNITRVFIHDETAYKVIFYGEVLGVANLQAGDQGIIQANLESGTIYFRNKIPRVVFQSYCNHVLYKLSETGRPGCNLAKELWKTTATVTILGNTISSSSFGTKPDDYFRGGHVETEYGDFRYVTDHVGNLITLNVAFDARLSSGGTVFAFPGCDKSPVTCTEKFDNFENFQGFAYIPSNNPTIWGVH